MERRRRHPILALTPLLLLLAVSIARADPGNVSEADGGEIRLNVSVGLTEGQKVSGTNVGFTAGGLEGADAGDSPDESSEPVRARVKGYKVVLAGTVVASYGSLATASGSGGATITPSPGGGPPLGTPVVPPANIRFASTHFSDGAEIVIVATVEFERQSRAYMGTGSNGTYDLPTKTVVATRTVEAYNNLQTLGTTDGSNSWYGTASDKAYVAAKGALSPSHPAQPSTAADSRDQNEVDIIDYTFISTVMSALAHGSTTGFDSSDGSGTVYFAPDIGSATYLRAVPGYNLVGFWSCSTLVQGDEWFSDSVTAYDVAFHNDRAYVGFNFSPAIRLWPGSDWIGTPPQPSGLQPNDMGDHATEFWNWISHGRTVGFALQRANEAFPPIVEGSTPSNYSTQPMLLIGDPRTRLIGVYLSETEETAVDTAGADPYTIWWIKL